MDQIPERLKGTVSKITVEPPVTPRLQELPYDQLPWEYFEKLCLRLAQKEGRIEDSRQYGEKGDEQEGIDLYQIITGSSTYRTYQCKRVKDFGPAKIKKAVELFLKGDWLDSSSEFILCTQESLGTKKREDEIRRQRNNLDSKGIELHLWDSKGLDSRLKSYPEIVEEFFGPGWVKAFCGESEYYKSRPRKKPERNTYKIPENYIARRVHEPYDDLLRGFSSDERRLIDEISENSRVALLGGAGVGKSVELQYLAHLAGTSEYRYYPYLIRLNIHTDKALIDYLPSIEDISEEQLLILLDGLDEVQTGHFDSVRRKILEFTNDFPTANVVVSCRLNFFSAATNNPGLSTLNGFKAFYLSDLGGKDIDAYLESTIPLKKESFLKEVYAKHLHKLITIPYYLLKLSQQYDDRNAISESKAALFEDIIGENIQKDVKRYFDQGHLPKAKEMREALSKLAFILEYQGRNHVPAKELPKILTPSEYSIVKLAGSLLIGEDESDSNWQFIHNNFQEYLAAQMLSQCNFRKVIDVICVHSTSRKVKPTWVNTISLLISIKGHEEGLGKELVDWLVQNEPSVMFVFEPDRVDSNLRVEVLNRVLTFFKKEKGPINRMVYRIEDLATFTKSEQSISVLVNALESDPVNPVNSSILEILFFYGRLDVFDPAIVLRVKTIIESFLFDDRVFPYQALKAYVECFDLVRSDFNKIIEFFKDSTDTWVLYTLYHAIHRQGYQNDYVELVIERTKKSMTHENRDTDRLTNEDYELRNCLSKLTEPSPFLKLLSFIFKDFGQISNSVYYREVIDDGLARASEEFDQNDEVYEKIKEGLLNKRIHIYDSSFQYIKRYFETTSTVYRVFKEVYSNGLQDQDIIYKLALLADTDCVVFLAEEFASGNLQIGEVKSFQHYLYISNSPRLEEFNNLINRTTSVELPGPGVDFEERRKKRFEQRIIILFNKEEFFKTLDQVFADLGKDVLSYDDVWEIRKGIFDIDDYLPEILDVIRFYRKGQTVERSKLLNRINENWMHYSIQGIINIIKGHSDTELTKDQMEYVKGWCDDKIEQVNFTTALSHPDENTTRANGLATKVSFLIRRLNFTHYSQQVYLDMLSFLKWNDNEKRIIDFVETVVPKEDIDSRVIKNIASGIEYHGVLESHLDYCQKHNLRQAAPSLIPYLMDHGFQRHDILKTYFELGGSNKPVESLLSEIPKDHFENHLVSELIKRKSGRVLSYVLECYNEAKEDDLKLEYAVHLIQLQHITGLKYYVQYIKKKKIVPHDSHPGNPLFQLHSSKGLPYIFQLYELSYHDKIKQLRFSNLRDISVTAWRNISLSNGNFIICKRIYKRFLTSLRFKFLLKVTEINTPYPKLKADLAFFFENIKHQYYIDKSATVNHSDALLEYERVRRCA